MTNSRRVLLFCDTALLLAALLSCSFATRARADREACIAAHEEAQLMHLRGRYSAAREQLLRCAQSACPTLIRSDCIARMSEVDVSLPSVVLSALGAEGEDLIDVHVSANGQLLTERLDGRALVLDPGVYELHFVAPGFEPVSQRVTVLEAEKRRLIRVQLQRSAASPAEPPRLSASAIAKRRYVASYALWAGGLAALGTGIALGAVGKRELERLDGRCGQVGCSESSVAHGKRLYIGADVAFALSGGLVLAATWLFLSTWRSEERRDVLALESVRAAFSPRGMQVGWARRF